MRPGECSWETELGVEGVAIGKEGLGQEELGLLLL